MKLPIWQRSFRKRGTWFRYFTVLRPEKRGLYEKANLRSAGMLGEADLSQIANRRFPWLFFPPKASLTAHFNSQPTSVAHYTTK
ncbi:hypothetical protein GCM10008018_18960 [Paenibacillus marchantiophytorum]|uniref:Uncharacterized protein n=1 Tax=Paenibacillus marchantiophytorum TaxID=1619310 RepID=A0ABQ2BVF5_9BACL|nr:hypothetical protein GCM10008018_18960 [Paenibacillus marchantiophytorum]